MPPLEADEHGTRVNWAMTGASSYLFKLMGLFMNMDEMIGWDFATGLATLKQHIEQGD